MYIFPCKRIRYIKPIAINTHIDCLNNSKCSVRYIFEATKQGALKVTLHHFLLQEILPDDMPEPLGKAVATTTVEIVTYGSEFVAAKTATEHIMDIRQTLRYLGAPIG